MMFPFPPFNMDNKNQTMPMPYGFFPQPMMPFGYNCQMMPMENAEAKNTKKQSPSDIGILLDKGLVNKKTV